MQRIVDGFVRSAHGAGVFYDGKARHRPPGHPAPSPTSTATRTALASMVGRTGHSAPAGSPPSSGCKPTPCSPPHTERWTPTPTSAAATGSPTRACQAAPSASRPSPHRPAPSTATSRTTPAGAAQVPATPSRTQRAARIDCQVIRRLQGTETPRGQCGIRGSGHQARATAAPHPSSCGAPLGAGTLAWQDGAAPVAGSKQPAPIAAQPRQRACLGVDPQHSQHKQQTKQQAKAPRPSSPMPVSVTVLSGGRQRSCPTSPHLASPMPHLLAVLPTQLHTARRRCRQPSPGRIEVGRVTATRHRWQRA